MRNPMKQRKNIKKLEKVFNIAEDVIQSLEINKEGMQEITLAPEAYQFDEKEIEKNGVLGLAELKADFLIAKRNLRKLIRHGQTLMDTSADMDMEEMTASKIMAIAQLSTSISGQLKMLVEIYKDIAEIEKSRKGGLPGAFEGNLAGVVHQNIIFTGDATSLMKYLKGKND